jgi:hypothetical protein
MSNLAQGRISRKRLEHTKSTFYIVATLQRHQHLREILRLQTSQDLREQYRAGSLGKAVRLTENDWFLPDITNRVQHGPCKTSFLAVYTLLD